MHSIVCIECSGSSCPRHDLQLLDYKVSYGHSHDYLVLTCWNFISSLHCAEDCLCRYALARPTLGPQVCAVGHSFPPKLAYLFDFSLCLPLSHRLLNSLRSILSFFAHIACITYLSFTLSSRLYLTLYPHYVFPTCKPPS